RTADTSNPRGYYELERVKDLDKPGAHVWLADARGKAVKIISFLLTHLPEDYDYQVLFMQRDLNEILASQNAMLEQRGEARGADDDRMRVLYEEHLDRVQRFMSKRPCFSTLMVDYSAVLAGPRAEAARIDAFLGGRLDEEKMAAVADRALYRNRRVAAGGAPPSD
ncbi:MAG: sulfotransferase family protein, partial [Acidobacteriota bacterium]|nr:sulfotransferase family protein [Acidobacteriota bacterium]